MMELCSAAREAYGPDGEIPGDVAQAGDDRRGLRRRPGRARVRTRSPTCCSAVVPWPGSAGSFAPLPMCDRVRGMTARPRWRNRMITDGSEAGPVTCRRGGGGASPEAEDERP